MNPFIQHVVAIFLYCIYNKTTYDVILDNLRDQSNNRRIMEKLFTQEDKNL